jgi:hypothetical protein
MHMPSSPRHRRTLRQTAPRPFCAEPLELRRLLSAAVDAVGPTPAPSALAVASADFTAAATTFAPVGAQPTGALTGRIVYTSGGHGWTWNGTAWGTGRGNNNGVVEDFGNQDQMSLYAQYALQAGATVVPMRPVGNQLNEVIVDNADAGFSVVSGSWANGTLTPYYSTNGGNGVAYRSATTTTTETAVARFTPTIAAGAAGFYPVYAWALDGSNRATDQVYRVNYAGGSVEVKVNHASVGKGWVYLGTYYFDSGTSGNVEVSNRSAVAGKAVIADAIRFGNGMGDVNRGGGVSGKPREDEAAYYWITRSRGYTAPGTLVPLSTFDGGLTLDDDANVGAPARWARYMNNAAFGQSVYLGFHSNAGGGRGADGLYNREDLFPGTATPNQLAWADLVGREVNTDMVGIGVPPLEVAWTNRTNHTFARSDYAFGEIRTSATGDEFDATIIEVAYHDNASDANLLKDPKARSWIARASYQATVKYFNQFGGLANGTLIAEPPQNVRATTDAAGNVTLNWDAPPTGAVTGNAGTASGYRVYASVNGYGFDAGTAVAGTSLTVGGLAPNAPVYFRVVATNAGGESFPSEVVVAHPQVGRRAPVLIVNNFDRIDRLGDPTQTLNGTVYRVRLRSNNTRDYVVQAAEAIRAANPFLGIESCSDGAVASGAINLADYQTVIWLSGEQSSGDGTFTAATQPKVTAYLNAGGKLFVSGSEIAWDLVAQGAGPSFFTSTLRGSYPADAGGTTYNNSDDAGTYAAAGAAGSIFAGLSLAFDNGNSGTYNVDFPDKIFPAAGSGATTAINYSGGTGGSAGIQYASGNTRLVFLGFPFETITTAANRNTVMGAVLGYFGTTSTITSPTPNALDLLAASDTGVSSSDDLTNRNNTAGKTLQFSVANTVFGSAVRLFADGLLVATGTGTGGVLTLTTTGNVTLADGAHTLVARQSLGNVDSSNSSAVAVTVDTVAPTVSFAAVFPNPRSTSLASETFSFSEAVANVSLAALAITRDGVDTRTGAESLAQAGNTCTLADLAAATTRAGTYTVQVLPAVTDLAGNSVASPTGVSWFMNAIHGTTGDDTIRLARQWGSASTLDVYVNSASPNYSVSVSAFPVLNVVGLDGADTLTLDFAQGPLTAPGGVAFDGGAGADTFVLTGSSADDSASLSPASATFGSVPITLAGVEASRFNGGAGADTLTLAGGAFAFSEDLSLTTANLTLMVADGSVTFAASQNLAGLLVGATGRVVVPAGAKKLLNTRQFFLAPGARMDLASNDLIWAYSSAPAPAADLTAYLASAYHRGQWDNSGLGSSTAADPSVSPATALGYADNAYLGYTTFAGKDVLPASMLTKYTWRGDANLDGKVDADDAAIITQNRALNRTGWIAGDFNYDGTFDADDFIAMSLGLSRQDQVL